VVSFKFPSLCTTFSGWVATLSGWLVTEIGRQPWLVTGILKTSRAVGRVGEAQLGASLTGYVLVYALMLAAYIVVVTHLAGKGTGSDAMPGGAYPKPAPQPPLMLESGDAK